MIYRNEKRGCIPSYSVPSYSLSRNEEIRELSGRLVRALARGTLKVPRKCWLSGHDRRSKRWAEGGGWVSRGGKDKREENKRESKMGGQGLARGRAG